MYNLLPIIPRNQIKSIIMKSNNYFTHSHKTLFLIIISLGFSLSIFSQDYAYIIESFEDPLWATVDNNPTTISMPSGQWTCYKDNVHTTEVDATDGIYSLLFTRKDGLLSPFLTNGVGLLTFSAIKNTGGTRTIYIETSIDNEDWELIESYNTQQEWEEKTVKVNDANIRYLRFRTNSNGSTFIDKVLMTKAGANDIKVITYPAITISQNSAIIQAEITTEESYQIIERGVCYNTIGNPDYDSDLVISHEVDNNIHVELNHLLSNTIYYAKAYAKTDAGVNYGNEISFTTRVGDEEIIYWVQPFDDTSYFPGSSPTTPQSIQVTGQGEWIYYKAYKNTNASYIIDDSPYGIRMLKNGSYVITPTFEDGVAKVYFDEGRTGKTITIYTSIDNGETWINHSSIVTDKSGKNSIIINSDKVNRIKIANDSGNDADIDNLSVTVFPSGIRPEVFTGDVIDISTNRATVSGQLISQGDKTVIERGICWSTQPIPLIGDNKNRYSGNDDSYTMDINDLPAMQQIYYRAYAFSRAGTGYGEIKSFLTQEPSIPELITLTATQITGETALVGASITNLGGGAIIEMGVCWSMEANSSINDNLILTQGDKTGFNVIIQPLTANTTYYYRSFVKTNGGIGYGQEETLTTGSISLPVVATNSTSAISPFQIKAEGTLMDNGNAIRSEERRVGKEC